MLASTSLLCYLLWCSHLRGSNVLWKRKRETKLLCKWQTDGSLDCCLLHLGVDLGFCIIREDKTQLVQLIRISYYSKEILAIDVRFNGVLIEACITYASCSKLIADWFLSWKKDWCSYWATEHLKLCRRESSNAPGTIFKIAHRLQWAFLQVPCPAQHCM